MLLPPDFVNRFKAEWPNEEGLHEELDAGDPEGFVATWLLQHRVKSVELEEIVEAFKQGRQDNLLEGAKAAIRANALFEEFKTFPQG